MVLPRKWLLLRTPWRFYIWAFVSARADQSRSNPKGMMLQAMICSADGYVSLRKGGGFHLTIRCNQPCSCRSCPTTRVRCIHPVITGISCVISPETTILIEHCSPSCFERLCMNNAALGMLDTRCVATATGHGISDPGSSLHHL